MFVCFCRSEERVPVTFVSQDGERVKVKGCVGDTLLKVVIDQKLDINGFGMCPPLPPTHTHIHNPLDRTINSLACLCVCMSMCM